MDFVFKRIFGAEANQDVLISFLNAVFEDAGQPLIASLEILNPFLEKGALSDKMSVLDVKARTQSGMLVDVEIQLRDRREMETRTLFYWSKLFQGQLQEGDSYRRLHKA
ncbi:MAG: Rpn family recombination-promoting nuclease/putative transposase [Thermaerobacter sp.]|nr:Rpn family recombination-promoting nuclease/putative transposase [Thermaerobacter sp.]